MQITLSDVIDKNFDLAVTVADLVGANCEYLITLLIYSPGIMLDKIIHPVNDEMKEGDAYYIKPFDAVGKTLKLFKLNEIGLGHADVDQSYGYYGKRREVDDRHNNPLERNNYPHERGMRIYRGGFFSKHPLNLVATPIMAIVGTAISATAFLAAASILTVTQIALLCLSPAFLLLRGCIAGPAQTVREIGEGCDLAYARPQLRLRM